MVDNLGVEDMTSSGRRGANVWSSLSYELPLPYLRPRVIPKDQKDMKRVFVPAPGDGPQYKFAMEKKGQSHTSIPPYGKEAKTPPVSYLPIPIWAKKKEGKKEPGKDDNKGAKTDRGSFIDAIFFNGKKYNFPGPDRYSTVLNKDSDKKDDKQKIRKEGERKSFLMDYQYLGLNSPGPGEYPLKDTWAETANKKKHGGGGEEKKNEGNAAQEQKKKDRQGHGPGQYDIVRLMTLNETTSAGGKQMKSFKSIPIFERAQFGIINKGHNTKRTVEASQMLAAPGSYFKKEGEIEKAFQKSYKPMRRY